MRKDERSWGTPTDQLVARDTEQELTTNDAGNDVEQRTVRPTGGYHQHVAGVRQLLRKH